MTLVPRRVANQRVILRKFGSIRRVVDLIIRMEISRNVFLRGVALRCDRQRNVIGKIIFTNGRVCV